MLIAGLALAGPAQAQGFSGSGVGGVAAQQGATASSGYAGIGAGAGRAVDGPVASVAELPRAARPRVAPTVIDFAPRDARRRASRRPL